MNQKDEAHKQYLNGSPAKEIFQKLAVFLVVGLASCMREIEYNSAILFLFHFFMIQQICCIRV